ncbi:class I SAM-dependent methyltransferase [uncultured Methanolobus sp.]|uniref:class I SAM-dependent methyltransferase n=1 Tax=uncultured Methanolobus sp. TaxID=218300 RepID=UPI0029C6385F|nr:class I SAM-dependent methyltransferase [uncultured Methanolobus sp.]
MEHGKIDWNEVWKYCMAAQQSANKEVENNLWNRKDNAERFWKRTQEFSDRTRLTLEELPLTPQSRVLDIGAGPGRLSIPIAERVAHVTAVEPAEGMRNILLDNVAEKKLTNLDCVSKRWEDIDVENDLNGPYDIVIASFSLGMPDIREAIQKMEQASSKHVYLYWFAGTSPWEEHSVNLWPYLYGTNYTCGPKCDVLYNVLYDMGIYPDMQVFPMEYTNNFASMDEAMDFFRSRYAIETPEQEAILYNYLRDELSWENGSISERADSTRVRICWEKKQNN